jgi:DNA/RNA endonuclease YhcR with UshA esterase domain
MTLKETLHRAFASQTEIEADEERTESKQQGCTALSELTARSRVTVSGILRSVTLRPREGVPALEAELYDGSGTIDLVWLGRREIAGIEPGRRLKLEGRVCDVDGRRVIFNPRYELRPRPGE